MLYYIKYGVQGCAEEAIIIKAEDEAEAYKAAEELAMDCWDSYVGSYGNLTLEEFAKQEKYEEPYTDECYDDYDEYVKEETFLYVREFDMDDDAHRDCLLATEMIYEV